MTDPLTIFLAAVRDPFKPFRLQLAGGQCYDVETPRKIYVSRHEIVLQERMQTIVRFSPDAVLAIETPDDSAEVPTYNEPGPSDTPSDATD